LPPADAIANRERSLNIRQASLLALVLMIAGGRVAAQGKGDSELRTIRGTVVDKSENPASSSVVYLLNVKTQAVRTYIADEAGMYRFSGLDPNIDYEVHAERDGMSSSTHTISSFDSRRDIDVILKLSHAKPPQKN
jgi:Carboxypeptidase regulatory-like domain